MLLIQERSSIRHSHHSQLLLIFHLKKSMKLWSRPFWKLKLEIKNLIETKTRLFNKSCSKCPSKSFLSLQLVNKTK